MAFTEEIADRGLGWPLGIGLMIAAVSAGPKIVKAGRPLIKSAIKGYLVLHEKSKEMFAETEERLQDLYVEAKHEFEQEAHVVSMEEHKPEVAVAEEAKPAEGGKPSSRAKKSKEESGEQ